MRARTLWLAILVVSSSCDAPAPAEPSPAARGEPDRALAREPSSPSSTAASAPASAVDATARSAEVVASPPGTAAGGPLGEGREPSSSVEPAAVGENATSDPSLLPAAALTPDAPAVPIPPPPPPSGLPAVARGKVIRLESLPVGQREVDGKRVPTVALASPEATQALDERLAAVAKDARRCQVMLALESFVSVRCTVRDDMEDMPGMEPVLDHYTYHYVIATDGTIEEVELSRLLHPPASAHDLKRRLTHDPNVSERRVVVTERGIELSYPFDAEVLGEAEIDRIPWRLVAPLVRADGPLGPILAAQGLPLAPVGTTMPELVVAPALWGHAEAWLLGRWLALPQHVRAHARLATPGGRKPVGLIFAPGTPTLPLEGLVERRVRLEQGYYDERIAKLVLVRTTAEVQVREQPGRTEAVVATLPAGTLAAAADGLVHRQDSAPASRQWAYVSTGEVAGWVMGKDVERVTEGE